MNRNTRYRLALLASVWLLFLPERGVAQSSQSLRAVTVTEGLEYPWGLAFLPDGRMLVTERPGRLRLVDADGRLHPQPVSGVPAVAAVGQGGLLDVALHPDFARNGWIYLSYAAQGEGGYGSRLCENAVNHLACALSMQ